MDNTEIIDENYTTSDMLKDIAVDTTRSLAITAGVWVGIGIAGLTVTKIEKIRAARRAAKAATETETV